MILILSQNLNKTIFKSRNIPTLKFIRSQYTAKKIGLATAYVPKDVEQHKYQKWEQTDLFSLKDFQSKSHKFSTILPPPNITGTLHLGHALTIAIEDSIVRWNRMRGVPTVWVPGLDHAGIATQVIVEKQLWHTKQKTRHDIGREEFIKYVWKWKDDKSGQITDQLKQLGASLDWSREIFTMDGPQTEAVNAAFIKLFDKGLIYRSHAMVNWSCTLQSAISDVEVEQVHVNGPTKLTIPANYDGQNITYDQVQFGVLYKFAYKIFNNDGSEQDEVTVCTTRPETILGDVAVAVHPEDERYRYLHGKKLWHPIRKEPIPVILDQFVDRDFGTGVVKISPAHDRTDFDISKKHSLQTLQVIDETGCISFPSEFLGQSRFEARSNIINFLQQHQLFRGMTDHQMIIPVCSRSKDVIEYLPKPQWFVNCKEMAEKACEAVRNGSLIIEPKTFEKNWFTWLENIHDWNISRQLWWGHRIPAYKCASHKEEIWVAAENNEIAKEKATKLLNNDIISVKQDEDVLDTWFSSGLMPFSAFGWPKQMVGKEDDFGRCYPLNMIETGHDILFFWVARMVMLGVELTGVLPFRKILLHGIICDSNGRKMSKSLGNVISPDDIIHGVSLKELNKQVETSYQHGLILKDEFVKAIQGQKAMFPNGIPACGVDALRFTLCSSNIKNHYISFNVNECNTNRLFCNKIWQATKYTQICMERLLPILDSRKQSFKEKQNGSINGKVGSGKSLGRQTTSTTTYPHPQAHHDALLEEEYHIGEGGDIQVVSLMDQWIMSRLSHLVEVVNKAIEDAELHVATGALKAFFYTEFCDIYVESTKTAFKKLSSPSEEMLESKNDNMILNIAYGHYVTLSHCLDIGLRCLAPFMPYMTEELYPRVPFIVAHSINERTSPDAATRSINDVNFPVTEHVSYFYFLE